MCLQERLLLAAEEVAALSLALEVAGAIAAQNSAAHAAEIVRLKDDMAKLRWDHVDEVSTALYVTSWCGQYALDSWRAHS